MGMFSFKKRKNSVGLDLGQRWIKVVELSGNNGNINLKRIGRCLLTREEQEEKIKTRQKISKLITSHQIEQKRVTISLAGHSVIIKRISLPQNLTQNTDYDEIIKKHAKEHIPFDLDNVYLDYCLLKNNEYFLVASKKEVVKDVIDLIEGGDLSIEAIDIEGFALSNCFEFNYPEYIQKTCYLIDIGSKSTIFCVYSKGEPLFIRDISIGGDQIIHAVKEIVGRNFMECEKLCVNSFTGLNIKEKVMLSQKIEEVYLKWIDEIQPSIFFHQSNYEPEEVEHIFLSGGGSLSQNLKQVFEEHLEKEIQYINPFKRINVSLNDFDMEYLKSVGPQFTIATGLALRNLVE